VALTILLHGSRSSRAALREGRGHTRHDRAAASSVVRPIGMAERRSELRRYGCDSSSCTTSSIPLTGQRGRPQPALQLHVADRAAAGQRAERRGPALPVGQPDLLDREDRSVRFFSKKISPSLCFLHVCFLPGVSGRHQGWCPPDRGWVSTRHRGWCRGDTRLAADPMRTTGASRPRREVLGTWHSAVPRPGRQSARGSDGRG
jgi:hypothetical protein